MTAITRALGLLMLLGLGASAGASTLTAGGNYAGTTHVNENVAHRNQDLTAITLDNANLSGTNFRNSILTGASLVNADLTNTILRNTTLIGANVAGAILTNALLRDANFTGANLSGANLASADVRTANFSGANLQGANLSGLANWNGANAATWTGATYNASTILPSGMNAAALGLIFVAEPSTALMLLAGLGGLAALGSRRSAPPRA